MYKEVSTRCDERVVKNNDGDMKKSNFGWIIMTKGVHRTVL